MYFFINDENFSAAEFYSVREKMLIEGRYGVFETSRFIKGRIPAFRLHSARFRLGCAHFGIDRAEDYLASVKEHLHRLALESLHIPLKARWEVLKNETGKTAFFLAITPAGNESSVSCRVYGNPLPDNSAHLSAIKTSRREFYQSAEQFAKTHSADQALIVNSSGDVAETSVASIWIETENEWISPGIESGGLDSIGSKVLSEFFRQSKIPFRRKNVSLAELETGVTVAAVNALYPFRVISSIDGKANIAKKPEWVAAFIDFFDHFDA